LNIRGQELQQGLPLIDLIVATGLAASKGEARRLVRGGGARVNGKAVHDEAVNVDCLDLADGSIKLSAGKKRHAVIQVA